MGQAKANRALGIVKGSCYKAGQNVKPQPLRIQFARVTAKWLLRHGYKVVEKPDKSPLG